MDNSNNTSNKRPYSQWKAMMAVAKASFLSSTRSPSAVLFTIFFPLIFIIAFLFLGNEQMKIRVAPVAGMDTTSHIYKALAQNPVIQFRTGLDTATVADRLAKGKLDATLDIQQRPGSSPEYDIRLTTTEASPDKGRLLQMIVSSLADKMNLQAAHIQAPVAQLSQAEVSGRKFKNIDFILPGQLGFAILSTAVFGTAFVFLSLRETLVIKRFFATPVKRLYIILGEAIARMVFAMLGALIIILVGYFFFDFTLVRGLVTLINLMAVAAIGMLVFMGFGFAISGMAKSQNIVPPLSNLITLPQFLLADTFIPVESFPTWLQYISKALPLTYMNRAMRHIAFDGASLIDVWPQLGILLLWGIAIYFLASRTFRWE